LRKVVHVSLHDVSPAFEAEVEQALELCARRSIRPALLVVPDYHERAPLESHPDFCARLRELQAAGHELYLHGFAHRSRPAPPKEIGQRDRLEWYFRQRVVSGGEAEFADLTRAEAIERLDRGLAVFERCGLQADGFVPPAWSMPDWVLPLLAERQIPFTEEHLWIHRPLVGDKRRSLVFNWATRTLERKISTVVFCRAARPLVGVLPTRIAIHPADMRSPLVVAEIRRMLASVRPRSIGRGLELFDP